MLQKQLLTAGSMLGALALGHQAVSADTVPTTTDTSRAQSVQSVQVPLPTVKAVVLSATDVTTSDASSTVDDGTTVHNGGVPNDDGTNTDNGGGSSSNDDGTNTDNGGSSSSSDSDSGSSSSNDNNNNGGSNTSNNGNTSHVVTVTPDNSGNAVNVPTQVASDADVSNAVKGYNQALTDNGKDASNEKVVQAKKNLDNAVAKALPKTHATEKSSVGGSGILALTMSGLIALGGLIYKRKHL